MVDQEVALSVKDLECQSTLGVSRGCTLPPAPLVSSYLLNNLKVV